MRSKMGRKIIAFMLCMVLVVCNGVSIFADTPAEATTTATQAKGKKSEAATKKEEVSKTTTGEKEQASETTTEKKEETSDITETKEESSEGSTEKKEEGSEGSTEKKEDASEDTTEKKEDVSEDTTEKKEDASETTTEKKEESETAKEEAASTDDKKKTDKTEVKEDVKEDAGAAELTYENDDVTITVSEIKEGAIPKDAELKVAPILESSDDTKAQYEEVKKKIQEKAGETDDEIKGFLAYDITFVDKNGKELEPNSEVKVSMEYKKAAFPASIDNTENTNITVFHLEEDENGNVAQVVNMGEAGQVETLQTAPDTQKIEKVEVKTKSFSAFVITWGSQTVEIHYVDTDGNSLDEQVEGKTIRWNEEETVALQESEYNQQIGGYIYQKSTVSSSFKEAPKDQTIYRLKFAKEWESWRQKSIIKYSDKKSGDRSWKKFDHGQKVYMVYEKNGSSGGSSGSGATENLAHRKYVTANEDGTYDLTLDVTGAVGTEENPAKVDVVFVLDTSGSMADDWFPPQNITSAKNAMKRLISSLQNKDIVDPQYKLVEFASSARTVTEDWKSSKDITSIIEQYGEKDCNGGTNYEAAFRKAGEVIKGAREDATSVVIFLTDGQPTYHGKNTSGGSSYTKQEDYNGALEGAMTINCDQFYAIGMGLPDDIGGWFFDGVHISGFQLLKDVAAKVQSKKKDVKNIDIDSDLSGVFEGIAGSIIEYTAKDVQIIDTLTDEVDQVSGTGLKVEIKNDRGIILTEDQKDGLEKRITANYNEKTKQLVLDFPEEYELKKDYTYSVTMTIKANEKAQEKYKANDYKYTDIGENDTGQTSAGREGFFSNKEGSAKVTWGTNGEKKEASYNRPVVQIPEEEIPQKEKLEPVNFYLNLSSAILDTSGNIIKQDVANFTTSVSGERSKEEGGQGIGKPINTDLRVKVPEGHQHEKIKEVYPVIGSDSSENAKKSDEAIRKLVQGTMGTEPGTTEEYYQIVNKQGEGDFPTDEEIFDYIKDNWSSEEGKGVNKGKPITVNGSAIDQRKLTTDNFTIRWYVFKDQDNDYWHVDGILVPKGGILNVTKTFPNETIAKELEKTFKISVTGSFLGENDTTTLEKTLKAADKKQVAQDGTVTYTWILAIFGEKYKVLEKGYTDTSFWEYSGTDWIYTAADGGEDKTGKTTSAEIETAYQTLDGKTEMPVQTFAFKNYYDASLDLKKVSDDENETLIDGAKFDVFKKEENRWQSIKENMLINNSDASIELKNLDSGIYKLEEIEAPKNHAKLSQPIFFKVKNDTGEIVLCNENGTESSGDVMWRLEGKTLTIKNKIAYSLPSTGGSGIYWYTVGGMLLMMGAALLVHRQGRKKELYLKK